MTGTSKQKRLIDHLNELRARLMFIALPLVLLSLAAFWRQEDLLALLQKPLGNDLYYSSPTGSFSFIFKMSVFAGIIGSLPVILYNVARFIEPAFPTKGLKLIRYGFVSTFLALGGVVFAYLVSLPSALHFLTNFGGDLINPLISADEYFNFALAYMLGFALIFQIPLVIKFIDSVHPLKPGGMMKAQRYIVVVSFVIAAILTPTPDPVNQLLMAAPAVVLYQVGVTIVSLRVLMHRGRHASPSFVPAATRPAVARELPQALQPMPRQQVKKHMDMLVATSTKPTEYRKKQYLQNRERYVKNSVQYRTGTFDFVIA